MAQLHMPDVPPGNLRALLLELHSLHARAGWPSTRELAYGRKFSHTAVHVLFTKTTTAPPRLTVLLDVVERLASMNRRLNVEETVDKFDSLWEAARNAPYITGQPMTTTQSVEDEKLASAASRLPPRRPNRPSDNPASPALRQNLFGNPLDNLTAIELDVLNCLANGLTYAEISDTLHISERTLAAHIARIFARTGVESLSEATELLQRSRTQRPPGDAS